VPQYVLDAIRAAGLAAATAFEYPTTAEQARAISPASHRVLINHGYPDALIPCIFCAKRSKKMHGADLHVMLRTECTINLTELVAIAKMKGAPAAPPGKPPPRRPPTSPRLRRVLFNILQQVVSASVFVIPCSAKATKHNHKLFSSL
jgi:hypothetical protein